MKYDGSWSLELSPKLRGSVLDVLKRLGSILEAYCSRCVGILRRLGRVLGALDVLLRRLGAILEASGVQGRLGDPGGVLGSLGSVWKCFGAFLGCFVTSWGRLEAPMVFKRRESSKV